MLDAYLRQTDGSSNTQPQRFHDPVSRHPDANVPTSATGNPAVAIAPAAPSLLPNSQYVSPFLDMHVGLNDLLQGTDIQRDVKAAYNPDMMTSLRDSSQSVPTATHAMQYPVSPINRPASQPRSAGIFRAMREAQRDQYAEQHYRAPDDGCTGLVKTIASDLDLQAKLKRLADDLEARSYRQGLLSDLQKPPSIIANSEHAAYTPSYQAPVDLNSRPMPGSNRAATATRTTFQHFNSSGIDGIAAAACRHERASHLHQPVLPPQQDNSTAHTSASYEHCFQHVPLTSSPSCSHRQLRHSATMQTQRPRTAGSAVSQSLQELHELKNKFMLHQQQQQQQLVEHMSMQQVSAPAPLPVQPWRPQSAAAPLCNLDIWTSPHNQLASNNQHPTWRNGFDIDADLSSQQQHHSRHRSPPQPVTNRLWNPYLSPRSSLQSLGGHRTYVVAGDRHRSCMSVPRRPWSSPPRSRTTAPVMGSGRQPFTAAKFMSPASTQHYSGFANPRAAIAAQNGSNIYNTGRPSQALGNSSSRHGLSWVYSGHKTLPSATKAKAAATAAAVTQQHRFRSPYRSNIASPSRVKTTAQRSPAKLYTSAALRTTSSDVSRRLCDSGVTALRTAGSPGRLHDRPVHTSSYQSGTAATTSAGLQAKPTASPQGIGKPRCTSPTAIFSQQLSAVAQRKLITDPHHTTTYNSTQLSPLTAKILAYAHARDKTHNVSMKGSYFQVL